MTTEQHTDLLAEENPYYWIVAVCLHLGYRKMNEHPGIFCLKLDDTWTIKVNGHHYDLENIPAMCASVEFNGWPAGIFGLDGGVFAAGSLANTDTFKEAIVKRMKRV